MWEVVKYVKAKESVVAGPLSWGEAFAAYAPLAEKFNATDADGNYEYPEVRISIHKVA